MSQKYSIFDIWLAQQRELNKTKELDWQRRFNPQPVKTKQVEPDSQLWQDCFLAIRKNAPMLVKALKRRGVNIKSLARGVELITKDLF